MKPLKRTTAEFIAEARSVHGSVYAYDDTVYAGVHTRLTIKCPQHGQFQQLPYKHLAGMGCRRCAALRRGDMNRKTVDELIRACRAAHGLRYDYSMIHQYARPTDSIPVVCEQHGVFHQRAKDHIRGSGCPKCSKRVSKAEQMWLDSLHIPKSNRQRPIRIDGVLYLVDAFIPETSTVYEFWGDYWHGNPVVYPPHDINPTNKQTFGELYQKTVDRVAIFQDAGYSLVCMWEHQWKQSCAAPGS